MDKDSFCDAVRKCENAMYALAFSLVQNDSDAGEVLSESIYRAYKNMDTLKNENAFKSWILRIVHHTAVEMIRKNTRMQSVEEIPVQIREGDENRITTNISVREAVKRLKQPYQTVVILFYYENLSLLQIAQITEKNIVTVKQQLSRARKMLRELLKEDFD